LAEYSDENMMDASNLASCLAPTLMPIPGDKDPVQYVPHTIEIIRTMIMHHEEIFPVNDDGPVYEKFAITIPMYEGKIVFSIKKNFVLVMVMKMKMMKVLVNIHYDDHQVMMVNIHF